MKIVVDDSACTGHGRCYVLAPTLFSADDEGHSLVLMADVLEHIERQYSSNRTGRQPSGFHAMNFFSSDARGRHEAP